MPPMRMRMGMLVVMVMAWTVGAVGGVATAASEMAAHRDALQSLGLALHSEHCVGEFVEDASTGECVLEANGGDGASSCK